MFGFISACGQHEGQGPYEYEPYEYEVTVNPVGFELMQKGSEQAFGRRVEELNFEEASQLVGNVVMASTQTGEGKATSEGRTVVDSKVDGKEALAGFGRQMAREMAPHVDDERDNH